MASRYTLILLLVVLIGCRPATPPPTSVDETQVTSAPGGEITASPATPTTVSEEVQAIRNAQYQLSAADTLQVVQLTNGTFEQGAPGAEDFISVLMTDFVWPLQSVGLVLTVALIGALVLVMEEKR